MNNIIIGKRYSFPVTIPPDGRYKNGLVESIDGDMVTLKTKSGEEWWVPAINLKPVK